MMKKSTIKSILMGFLIAFSLFSQPLVFGQIKDASPSSTEASTSATSDETKRFIDKVQQAVKEKNKEGKAISGFVTKISGSIFTIKDENGTEYEIKPDEALAKYYQIVGNQRKEIKFSDITKDTFIIVMGVITDNVVNANTIYTDEMFLVKSGKITEVDKNNYSLKVLSSDKDTYTLDIEATTKQQMLNVKTVTEETSGFSKIKEGDTIHFVVKRTGKEKDNTYTANKILIIPQEFFMK